MTGLLRSLCVILMACCVTTVANSVEPPLLIGVGSGVRAPIGWTEFCQEMPRECNTKPLVANDAILTQKSWRELVFINKWVNGHVRPMTDILHWGVEERWSYPDDGYGDCEDYVLLKRRMLIEAGWPRQALLITVVRDAKNEGHAVLTIKTDKGEFILDNMEGRILLWSETGYRFIKRQSQTDPNQWVSLGDPRPATASISKK